MRSNSNDRVLSGEELEDQANAHANELEMGDGFGEEEEMREPREDGSGKGLRKGLKKKLKKTNNPTVKSKSKSKDAITEMMMTPEERRRLKSLNNNMGLAESMQ